jgi:hypothetical protein
MIDVANSDHDTRGAAGDSAHRRQRQDSLRWAAGTRAIAVALIVIAEHQQGVSKEPLRAGAQSFGPPQSGQT